MDTKIIKWSRQKGFSSEEIKEIGRVINDGGLVAFPTETVYGLGGNGLNPKASKKIYEAKGRPSDNPLILHISKLEDLNDIVEEISDTAKKLMDKFWPGPMTLIFKKSQNVPYETTGGLDTVAVRYPNHQCAIELIEGAGRPIAAPSANLSGRPSPTKAEHVYEDLKGKIDIIVDGGEVGIGLESTIIDMTGEKPLILRPGYITKDMINEVIGDTDFDPAILKMDENVAPKAPGMKYRHYAPKAKMLVVKGEFEKTIEYINQRVREFEAGKVGILASEEARGKYESGQVVYIGSRQRKDLMHGLYDGLRKFDELNVDFILSESFYEEDKSEAIMNRLLKAAGQNLVEI